MNRQILILTAVIIVSSFIGAYVGRDRRYTIRILCCEQLIEPYELISGYLLKLDPSYKVILVNVDGCEVEKRIRVEKPDLVVLDDRFLADRLLSRNLIYNYTVFGTDSLVLCYKNGSWVSDSLRSIGLRETLRIAWVAAVTDRQSIVGLRTRAFLKLAFNCSLELFSNLIECSSCLLYTSPSPRDRTRSRMPSSA